MYCDGNSWRIARNKCQLTRGVLVLSQHCAFFTSKCASRSVKRSEKILHEWKTAALGRGYAEELDSRSNQYCPLKTVSRYVKVVRYNWWLFLARSNIRILESFASRRNSTRKIYRSKIQIQVFVFICLFCECWVLFVFFSHVSAHVASVNGTNECLA